MLSLKCHKYHKRHKGHKNGRPTAKTKVLSSYLKVFGQAGSGPAFLAFLRLEMTSFRQDETYL